MENSQVGVFLADAVYGSDFRLYRMLEERGQSHVLAVRSNHYLRFLTLAGLIETDPAAMADGLEDDAWAAQAAGEGSKGLRLYDWARLAMPWPCREDRDRWLLICRSRNDPDKRAYYLVYCPTDTALAELAGATGLRWSIEECFQKAKDESLRSPPLVRLASPYQPRHGRRHLPRQTRRRPAPRRIRQTERNEAQHGNRRLTLLTAFVPSVPEIRTLLARMT